jgi:coenzyme F420-dependent glucose-6-phosphate dehydrogenase
MSHATPSFGMTLDMDLWHVTEVLKQAKLADNEGFDNIWVSDHFHPWSHTGSHEGFTWVLIASAAEATRRTIIGTLVTAPLLRYHPGIVAQAFATLGAMYPKRIILGLGTGEAMNEVPLGYDWPPLAERLARFEEAVRIIRLLWTKDFVSYKGAYYRLNRANLYDRPSPPVPMFISSNGPVVTRLAGRYSDGYFTHVSAVGGVGGGGRYVKERLFPALEQGAKDASRDPESIKKCVVLPCSYDDDYDNALESCGRKAANLVPGFFELNLGDPRMIEALGSLVNKEDYSKLWVIATDPEPLIKKAEEDLRLGFSHLTFTNFGPDQTKFIQMCGRKVVPVLKDMFKQ